MIVAHRVEVMGVLEQIEQFHLLAHLYVAHQVSPQKCIVSRCNVPPQHTTEHLIQSN